MEQIDPRALDIFSGESAEEEAAFFTGMSQALLRLVSAAPTKAEEARFVVPAGRFDERDARRFVLDMTKRCCFTLTTTAASLHYVRKLVEWESIAFNAKTWRTIWVVAMVLAEKYWEDNYVHPVHILQTYSGNSKSADYSDMQTKLFEMLGRQMNVAPDEFRALVQECIDEGRSAPEPVDIPVFVPRPLPEVKKWVHSTVSLLHVPRAAYKDYEYENTSSTSSGCVTDCDSTASNASFHGALPGFEHRASRARFVAQERLTSAHRSMSVQYPRGPSPPMRQNVLNRSVAQLDVQDPRRALSRLRLHDVRRSPTAQTRSARALPHAFQASPLSGSRSARGRPGSPRARPEPQRVPRAPAAAHDRQAHLRPQPQAQTQARWQFQQPRPVMQAPRQVGMGYPGVTLARPLVGAALIGMPAYRR